MDEEEARPGVNAGFFWQDGQDKEENPSQARVSISSMRGWGERPA